MKYAGIDKKCTDCSYDKNGNIDILCGPCEEEGIRQRIKWWQDGKRKLKEKNNRKKGSLINDRK